MEMAVVYMDEKRALQLSAAGEFLNPNLGYGLFLQ